MARRLPPLALALGFIALLAIRVALSFDRLPARMATHFDLAGKPNGFQSREGFVWTAALLSVLLLALFAVLPALLARLPVRFINLPNKDYWLAPERRAETIRRMAAMCDWLACATIALLVGVFELVMRANLAQRPLGFQLWILLPSYHLFVLFWIVNWFRITRRPDGA
jgi:serine/threonine-protein kinase